MLCISIQTRGPECEFPACTSKPGVTMYTPNYDATEDGCWMAGLLKLPAGTGLVPDPVIVPMSREGDARSGHLMPSSGF